MFNHIAPATSVFFLALGLFGLLIAIYGCIGFVKEANQALGIMGGLGLLLGVFSIFTAFKVAGNDPGE